MKVLFQSRIDLFSRRGGDTIQLEKTAEELQRLGVEVEIDCSAKPDLSGYDLVHLFNIDWPAQVYLQAKNAKKQGKPIVLAPIHHSHREIERYEREARYGLRRLVNAIFRTRESREKFKDFCRMLSDLRKISSTLVEFREGILSEQKELLEMTDLVLVQTEAEAKEIEADFGFTGEEKKGPTLFRGVGKGNSFSWVKVVNGVDSRFAEATPDWFVGKYKLSDFILCVGRIEPRKNQLAVIEAIFKLRKDPSFRKGRVFPTVFVGKVSWRHPEYALRFLALIRKYHWIHHISQIPYEKIDSCYAASRVHVLASWFETTGLVNLEAGLAGANAVATGERAREYLLDFAEYADPGNADSIAKAITKAWAKPYDPNFKRYILENFTWEKAAEQTLEAYKMVLSRKY